MPISPTTAAKPRGDARSHSRSPRRPFRWASVARAAATVGVAAAAAGVATPARAEAPRFTGEVDRNQVAVGEAFVYEATLSVGNDQVSDYRPPDFKGLRVLETPAGPNQSTQMQLGGGGMFVQITYSWRYALAATQKGTVAIGPARVRVNGQEFRSSVVTISALAGGGAAGPPPLGAAPPSGATTPLPGSRSASPQSSGAGAPFEPEEGSSFIRLVTDKQKAFVGEAIEATWYLYLAQSIDHYEVQVAPRTEGFWTEDADIPSRRGNMVFTDEEVQGRRYRVAVVMKKALFPLEPGHLIITPFEADISRTEFFFGPVRSQRVRSAPATIEVAPLPKAGQPAGWDAGSSNVGVGSFTLTARVDRAEVGVGEAVTLTVAVGGRGNLRKLALPAIPKLDGWKSYDPRLKVVVDPATGATGSKIAEVLLLPERPGSFSFPALALDYFDPEARAYRRAQTPPLALKVTGGAAGAPPAGAGSAAAPGPGVAPGAPSSFAENVIAGDIRPLHARASLRRDLGGAFLRRGGFLAVLVVTPLGYFAALVALRVRDRLSRDTGSRRRRRGQKRVRALLSSADGHRRRGDQGAFFLEIDRVIREALATRLGVSVKGLSLDELGASLRVHGFSPADTARLTELLEECDRVRFAPGSRPPGDAAALSATLDAASALIDIVEKAPLASGVPA